MSHWNAFHIKCTQFSYAVRTMPCRKCYFSLEKPEFGIGFKVAKRIATTNRISTWTVGYQSEHIIEGRLLLTAIPNNIKHINYIRCTYFAIEHSGRRFSVAQLAAMPCNTQHSAITGNKNIGFVKMPIARQWMAELKEAGSLTFSPFCADKMFA